MALLSTMSYAQSFTTDKKVFRYAIHTDKPMDLRVNLSTQKKICNTQLEILNNDNESILDTQFMMTKEKGVFNAPVSSGDYTLVYKPLSFCNGINFDLSITKVTGNFEVENNNDMSSTTPLKELIFFSGYYQRWNDKDYYKIDIAKDSKMRLVFSHPEVKSFGGYTLELLNANNKKVTIFKNSVKEPKLVKKIQLKKGAYFLKITKSDTSSIVQNIEYKIAYTILKSN